MMLRTISAGVLLLGALLSSGCWCCWDPCCNPCGSCCSPCCSPCCCHSSPVAGHLVSDHARLVPTPAATAPSSTWQGPMPSTTR